MPEIRDRRAAGLAVLLALLGSASIMMGLRVEPEAQPLVAAAEPAPAGTNSAAPEPSAAGKPSAAGETSAPGESSAPRGPSAPAGVSTSAGAGPPAVAALPRSVPEHLEIPAIGLRTDLSKLGLNPDGTIEVPPLRANAPAGWYEHSPTPGEPGASVLVGHVDSAREGPAVFFRLRELRPGDTIAVRRTDGAVARFAVTRTAAYPKLEFPTNEVYGPVDRPELRLVTCGGSFDRTRGSYRSNIVVFARALTAAEERPA